MGESAFIELLNKLSKEQIEELIDKLKKEGLQIQ